MSICSSAAQNSQAEQKDNRRRGAVELRRCEVVYTQAVELVDVFRVGHPAASANHIRRIIR